MRRRRLFGLLAAAPAVAATPLDTQPPDRVAEALMPMFVTRGVGGDPDAVMGAFRVAFAHVPRQALVDSCDRWADKSARFPTIEQLRAEVSALLAETSPERATSSESAEPSRAPGRAPVRAKGRG